MSNPTIVLHNMVIIAEIIQACAVILGLFMLIGAFMQLKKYGEMRAMASYQLTMSGPLMMMIGGALLLALPTFIDTALMTFVGSTTPLHYAGSIERPYMEVVIVFIRVVGVGSMVRGIVLLARSGGQQSQPGTTGKAVIHIIAGVMAIHILGTMTLLGNILDV